MIWSTHLYLLKLLVGSVAKGMILKSLSPSLAGLWLVSCTPAGATSLFCMIELLRISMSSSSLDFDPSVV